MRSLALPLLLGASAPALAQTPAFYPNGGDLKPLERGAFTDAVHVVIEDPGNCGLSFQRAEELAQIGYEVQQIGASWCAYWPLDVQDKQKDKPLFLKERTLPGASDQLRRCYKAESYAGAFEGVNGLGEAVTYVILPSDHLADGNTVAVDCSVVPHVNSSTSVHLDHSPQVKSDKRESFPDLPLDAEPKESGRMAEEPVENLRGGEFFIEWPDGTKEPVKPTMTSLTLQGNWSLQTYDKQYIDVSAYDRREKTGDHYAYTFVVTLSEDRTRASGPSLVDGIKLPRYSTLFSEKTNVSELQKATYKLSSDPLGEPFAFESWDSAQRILTLRDPSQEGICYENNTYVKKEGVGKDVTYWMELGDIVNCEQDASIDSAAPKARGPFLQAVEPLAGVGVDMESLVDPYGLGVGAKARLGVALKSRPGELAAFIDFLVDVDHPGDRLGLDRAGLRVSHTVPTDLGGFGFALNTGWSMDPQFAQLNGPFAGLEFSWAPQGKVGPLGIRTGLSMNNDFLGNQYPNLETALLTELSFPVSLSSQSELPEGEKPTTHRLSLDTSKTFSLPSLQVPTYTGAMDAPLMKAEEVRLREELHGSPKAYYRKFLSLKALADASLTDKVELSIDDYRLAVDNARLAGDDWVAHQLILEAQEKLGDQVPAELLEQLKKIEEGYGFVHLPPRLKSFPSQASEFGSNPTLAFAAEQYIKGNGDGVLFLPAGEYTLEGYEPFTVESYSQHPGVQAFRSERLKK
jgi:hypothetical protein